MIEKKNIDDIFEMCDSRYALVNAISSKARAMADDAEAKREILDEKPVIMVLNNLLSGKSTITKQGAPASVYQEDGFEVTVSSEENEE